MEQLRNKYGAVLIVTKVLHIVVIVNRAAMGGLISIMNSVINCIVLMDLIVF